MNLLKRLIKREALNSRMTIPVPQSMKDRYASVSNKLSQADYGSLHDLTRERIAQLLDEVENELGLKKIS